MNRIIELAVFGLGGLSLFVVAFLGFATMSGASLSELAVIGPLFAEEEQPQSSDSGVESVTDPGAVNQVYTTTKQVVDANMGLLSAYALEPPYTATELKTLAVELKASKLRFDERNKVLDEREEDLVEREELVSHQFQTLSELQAELERFDAELRLRAQEVERDETAQASAATPGLSSVSKLFEAGSAEDLVGRLTQYQPAEAAEILSNLDDERASALLNALPADQWKAYVDAYSSLDAGK